jgi:putative phosphoesterase
MRIGVVGDTHDRLANVKKIVNLFNDSGVERVVHTGDLTKSAVLEEFANLDAPLFGVFGNNDLCERSRLDSDAKRLGQDFTSSPRTFEWAGRRILVLHDPEEVAVDGTTEFDLVLHGHTHRHRQEARGRTLFFNPGECAGFLTGHNAIGVVDLSRLEAERLFF